MNEKDCVIIGQGPAGLSAAIYTSRAGLDTVILGCDPKVAGDYDIDNYFGFHETISGKELINRGVTQAERFGTEIHCDKVLSIHMENDMRYVVKTETMEFNTCSIILSTGVSRNKPRISNLDDFEGKGVSYCVSCDGYFFREKKVMVLGEGNYAANQALELNEYTPHVSLCTLGKEPVIAPQFVEKIADKNINMIEKNISALKGDTKITGVVYDDGEEEQVDGLFIALGDASSSDFAQTLGIFTQGIFIQVDQEQKTNAPGVFAAGDCVGGFLQISKAVGEGAVAAKSAIEYVKENCRK